MPRGDFVASITSATMSDTSWGSMPPLVSQSATSSAPASIAVEEVLGVQEHSPALRGQQAHRVTHHREVLVRRGAQGEFDMTHVRLGYQRYHGGTRVDERPDLRVICGHGARTPG